MAKHDVLTSKQWADKKGITVLDPDGWDRQNFEYSYYEELINEAEFDKRCHYSTTMVKRVEK